MPTLSSIILSCFLITLCVFIAVLLLSFNKKTLHKITIFLVSLSAGALMGGAFLHLLPEASQNIEINQVYYIVLLAFIFFFFMEKILYWRNCHKEKCKVHPFAYMNLLGDALHNFIDGLVIASAFIIDYKLGITTTLAIALHEIPQEIGDFGVLIHAGINKMRALFLNYLIALTVVLGGIVGYFISFNLQVIIPYLLPFAAGGFIYISASDLMPEIRQETNKKKSILSFFVFLLGIFLMFSIKLIHHH